MRRGRNLAGGWHRVPGTITAIALVVAGLGFAAPGGANGSPPQPCDRTRSQTLLANRYIRVYRDGRTGTGGVFACDRSSGLRAGLGNTETPTEYLYAGRSSTVLRGHVVASAYVNAFEAPTGPVTTIVRAVLPKNHSGVTSVPRALISSPSDPAGKQALAVRRILIAPNQTVLLTACTARHARAPQSGCASDASIRVIAVPRTAYSAYHLIPTTQPMTIADATSISATSLRLSPSGKRVAWNDAGHRRTAHIP